jgi:hypothetical protein
VPHHNPGAFKADGEGWVPSLTVDIVISDTTLFGNINIKPINAMKTFNNSWNQGVNGIVLAIFNIRDAMKGINIHYCILCTFIAVAIAVCVFNAVLN